MAEEKYSMWDAPLGVVLRPTGAGHEAEAGIEGVMFQVRGDYTQGLTASDKVVSRHTFRDQYPGTKFYEKLPPLRAKKLARRFQDFRLADRRETFGKEHGNFRPTLGADPEVFVERADGSVLPAPEFLPSKSKPLHGPEATYSKFEKSYWDGFQGEFTVYPCGCLNIGNDSIHRGLGMVLGAARKVDPKAKLSAKTLIELSPEQLEQAPEECVELGCKPSRNAYGLKGQEVAVPRLLKYRFAGGHLHFGHKMTPALAERVVRALDAIVGVPSVVLFQDMDNPIRRRFYGLPGEYRLPSHGVEYRVLSNAWMCHPAISQLVRGLARQAMKLAVLGLENWFEWEQDRVVGTILHSDVEEAKKHLKKNKEQYSELMRLEYGEGLKKQSFQALGRAVKETIQKPEDLEGNWFLTPPVGWTYDCGTAGTRWGSYAQMELRNL